MTTDPPPLFTVVTVALNDLAGLQRTWESVACQDGARTQWVVVDGASTDGSAEWLSSLDDARVRFVSEKDAGIYDAMNKGIALADGDLLVFLGGGDRLVAGALGAVGADWAVHHWAWAYGLSRVVDSDGELVQVASFVPFRRRWLELGYRALNHQACFFSRDLVARLGGYDVSYPIFADQEFCIRAAAVAPPRVLGEVVAEFVTGGVSSGLPAGSFVWPARRIRRTTGRVIAGSAAVDLVVAAAVWTDLRLRDLVTRRVHRNG